MSREYAKIYNISFYQNNSFGHILTERWQTVIGEIVILDFGCNQTARFKKSVE